MLEFLLLMIPDEDQDKFRAVYDEYKGLVNHIAYKHLRHTQDAEDVQQEAFLYIAKTFGKIKDRTDGEIKAYISTVSRGFAISYYRKRQRLENITVDVDIDKLRDIDDKEFDTYDLVDLERAMAKLPPETNSILELKLGYGLESKEIAEIHHISDSNCRKKVERAKKALMKVLLEEK